MEENIYVTIKIRESTNKKLKEMKGYNGCVSVDDVIKYLVENYKN